MKYFIAVALVCLTFLGLGYAFSKLAVDSSDLRRFSENGVAVYGEVTGKDPADHQRVEYSYHVDGVSYHGKGQGGSGNPSFQDLQIGQQVVVFYDPARKESSFLGYPQIDLKRNEQFAWAITIFFPVFPTLIAIGVSLLIWSIEKRSKRER